MDESLQRFFDIATAANPSESAWVWFWPYDEGVVCFTCRFDPCSTMRACAERHPGQTGCPITLREAFKYQTELEWLRKKQKERENRETYIDEFSSIMRERFERLTRASEDMERAVKKLADDLKQMPRRDRRFQRDRKPRFPGGSPW